MRDVIGYVVLVVAIFFLGLLNWAEFRFDWDELTFSYISHTISQVLAYGAIMSVYSSKRIRQQKENNATYLELSKGNYDISTSYRADKLKEYIHKVNMESKRDAYIDKYNQKLSELENKYSKKDKDLVYQLSWEKYQKEKTENPDAKAPNKYCAQKEYFLDKLENVDDYYKTESVKFERLKTRDLTRDVRRGSKNDIPRTSETTAMAKGLGLNMMLMLAFSVLSASVLFYRAESVLDVIGSTLITIYLVLFSTLKGMMNGEHVFETNVLDKEKFRYNHLYSYCVMEATLYGYNVAENIVSKQDLKQSSNKKEDT